jgi:hypothetical protein
VALRILDVHPFKGTDCDTDHCLVVAKVRKKLSLNKQAIQSFDMERFNIKKLNGVEGKEQHQVKISNMFAILEVLNYIMYINSAWESAGENIKMPTKESLGYHEVTQNETVVW